jgi:hypothetical protein
MSALVVVTVPVSDELPKKRARTILERRLRGED